LIRTQTQIIFEGPPGLENKKLDCILVLSPTAAPPYKWQLSFPPQVAPKTGTPKTETDTRNPKPKTEIGTGCQF
jgi:hypothetical protein